MNVMRCVIILSLTLLCISVASAAPNCSYHKVYRFNAPIFYNGQLYDSNTSPEVFTDINASDVTWYDTWTGNLIVGTGNLGGGSYENYRPVMFFNTSEIPNGAAMTGVVLSTPWEAKLGSETFYIYIGHDPTNIHPENPMVESDYDKSLYYISTDTNISSDSIVGDSSTVTNFTFANDALEFIVTSGVTKLIMFSSYDITETPGGDSYDYGQMYNYATYLDVNYNCECVPPSVSFSSNVTTGRVPTAIEFYDSSEVNVTSWFWDFGDGNTSTEQNPVHIYDVVGTHNVAHSATNSAGTTWFNQTGYITIDPPLPCPSPTLSWQFATGDYVEFSPIVYNGNVYFGSYDAKFYAVNTSSHDEVWNFTATDSIWGNGLIGNGVVYFRDTNLLHAVNISDGTEKWNYTIGSTMTSPTSNDDMSVIYYGDMNGNASANDAITGDLIWTNNTGGTQVFETPLFNDNNLYFGTYIACQFCAYDALTGVKIWENLDVASPPMFPPIYHNGIVYDGNGGNAIAAIFATNGTTKWNNADGSGQIMGASFYGDRLYVIHDGYVAELDMSDGSEMWTTSVSDGYSGRGLVIVDGIIYVGGSGGIVHAIDTNDGTILWEYLTAPDGIYSSQPTIDNGYLYIGNDDYNLYVLNISASLGCNVTPIPTPTPTLPQDIGAWTTSKANDISSVILIGIVIAVAAVLVVLVSAYVRRD